MKIKKNIKVIFWDFDGVIIDSMHVRDFGFKEIFKEYDSQLVKKLINYHRLNGGLSRYVKIRYFFEEILNQNISEEELIRYAYNFSSIMRNELVKKKYLISDSINFIKNNFNNFNFHIVSGSDHKELLFLNKELQISKFFLSINGSPTPKNEIVRQLIHKFRYNENEIAMIGDSINDYEAAKSNNIKFYGYNNDDLKSLDSYIKTFTSFKFL